MSRIPETEDATPMPPTLGSEATRQWVRSELSMRSRLSYVLLLLLASGGLVVVGSLWLTEPSLPLRTQIAFGGLCGICLAWVCFCGWVLTRRKVLYAKHQIVSARMAVAFCVLFILGSLAVGFSQQNPGGYLAAAVGVGWLGLAIVLLVWAERRHAALLDLRRTLETEEEATELAA